MIKIAQSSDYAPTDSANAFAARSSIAFRNKTEKRQLLGIKISGIGSSIPEQVVTNSDLVQFGCDESWIEQRTGIRERRYARPNQNSSDLASEAALNSLQSNGICADQISLVIVATTTPDYAAPSTAALVQGKIGCHNAAAIDINAGCTGFVHALITAGHFVASGLHQHVLVIGAEVIARKCDPRDPKIRPLFGDGAGAVLLSASDRKSCDDEDGKPDGILNYVMGSDGQQSDLITMNKDGSNIEDSYIEMDGRSVFKWATQHIPDLIDDTLESADLVPSDIDLFVLHQANQRIIDAAIKRSGISDDRFFVNIDRFGNTSSASIPIALDEARQQGRINRDSQILFCGFGAGLNWSACIFRGFDGQ